MKDNLYIVKLEPDEFHELLSEYESYVERCSTSMSPEQQEVANRVLEKLREADATHVCVDDVHRGGQHEARQT